jgi:DNA-binding transcriptional LysR family regulator
MVNPFDLNIRHLRGLLAVQELGSVSAAAESLSLSQPALTQGIVKLERMLGQVLFERRSDGMVLNDAGHLLAPRVASAMTLLSQGAKALGVGVALAERRVSMSHLRACLAVVDTGSFALAAEREGISQPAVHRAVRELEDVLQKKLIERRGRGVHVNFVGRRFARYARLAVHELNAAFSDLGIDPTDTTITVGTTPLTRAFLTPEAMATMVAEKYPAGFRVFEGSWGELVELLRDGVLDLIVGELPDHESPDLEKMPLYQEALVIVAGRQHPLIEKKRITQKDLASYPWIVAADVSPLRAKWESLFPLESRPAAPVECGSIMIIGRLLTSSDLLTLATPDQVALQIRSGLLARVGSALSDSEYTVGITKRKSWRPTAAQQRFIDALHHVSVSGRKHAHVNPEWV